MQDVAVVDHTRQYTPGVLIGLQLVLDHEGGSGLGEWTGLLHRCSPGFPYFKTGENAVRSATLAISAFTRRPTSTVGGGKVGGITVIGATCCFRFVVMAATAPPPSNAPAAKTAA
jgi:hypothetical protein